MKLFDLCTSCEQSVNALAGRNGGVLFCPHEVAGNAQAGGVLVTIIPGIKDTDPAQFHVIFPATGAEALAHERKIAFEMADARSASIQ